jgi:hypothetical protein
MLSVFLGISFMVWGFVCLSIAVVYMFFHPHSKTELQSASPRNQRYFILRWFHSVVWFLLGLSCFMWGDYIPGRTALANILALLSLLFYIIFMAALVIERKARR